MLGLGASFRDTSQPALPPEPPLPLIHVLLIVTASRLVSSLTPLCCSWMKGSASPRWWWTWGRRLPSSGPRATWPPAWCTASKPPTVRLPSRHVHRALHVLAMAAMFSFLLFKCFLSCSFCRSVSLSVTLSLSLSLSVTLSLTLCHSLSVTLSLTLCHSLSL